MALNATIYKAALRISDVDRGAYGDYALTIARHPSETDERMMVRLLAYCLHASAGLSFGKGLSTGDEPDLWARDLTGAVVEWIDVGQPDEKRIRRACGRASAVYVYPYGQAVPVWWAQVARKLDRLGNLAVIRVPADARELAALAARNMRLTCTIQDRHVWLADDRRDLEIELESLKSAGG
jgi:uncharacterized protein YaeQ